MGVNPVSRKQLGKRNQSVQKHKGYPADQQKFFQTVNKYCGKKEDQTQLTCKGICKIKIRRAVMDHAPCNSAHQNNQQRCKKPLDFHEVPLFLCFVRKLYKQLLNED